MSRHVGSRAMLSDLNDKAVQQRDLISLARPAVGAHRDHLLPALHRPIVQVGSNAIGLQSAGR